MRDAMLEEGYSESYADSCTHLKETDSWQALLEDKLSDEKLTDVHDKLLTSSRLDHMVFPLLKIDDFETTKKKKKKYGEELTDDNIREMLSSVNCTVRKIVHGEQARHVYFWAADNRAREKGLDMAYKLKKKYGEITVTHKLGELSDTEVQDGITGGLSEIIGFIAGKKSKKGK